MHYANIHIQEQPLEMYNDTLDNLMHNSKNKKKVISFIEKWILRLP